MKNWRVPRIRLVRPVYQERYDFKTERYFGSSTDKWTGSDTDRMFCACCGADWYGWIRDGETTMSKMTEKQIEAFKPAYGIGVYLGQLPHVKSNELREIAHIKTKNGNITCWVELPRDEKETFDDEREW